MHFLVDNINKVIFGWSAKSGCSHIKQIYWFFQTNNINNRIHTTSDSSPLPNDIENYNTVIFCRNPYKRLVSGFLDKYKVNGEFRNWWKYDVLTFAKFVDELVKSNWSMIHDHHFRQQTSEFFDKNKVIKSKTVKVYDIESIDYSYLESLFNKKIPIEVLNFTGEHKREKYNINTEENVYDLDISIYYNSSVDIKYFFNEEINNKVYKFFENDFTFFKEYGINYEKMVL